MAKSYFEDFWIVTDKGEKLCPALIENRTTGKSTYRLLAEGSNKKEDGYETVDPVEAIRLFLGYRSLRFGSEGRLDNRFKRGSRFVREIGATPAFKKANPSLRW